jgi:hypothetical protein
MEIIKYDFAEQFTKNPGLRFKKLSPGESGEEFRDEVLRPILQKQQNIKLIINVNGIESAMGASFLSEAFGVLAVEYGKDKLLEKIDIDTSSKKGKITREEMIKRIDEAIKKSKS